RPNRAHPHVPSGFREDSDMATTAPEIRDCRLYIGGKWQDAAGGETFEDRDPFSGAVVARVAAGGHDDARQAVEAAAAAFPNWAASAPAERQRVFLRAADLVEARRGMPR